MIIEFYFRIPVAVLKKYILTRRKKKPKVCDLITFSADTARRRLKFNESGLTYDTEDP